MSSCDDLDARLIKINCQLQVLLKMNNFIFGCQSLVSVWFLFSKRDMHLLSKINVNLVLSCLSCVHLYMAIHFIITFHIFCIHDSDAVHMHAIGVPEGVTLLEFKQELQEEQQVAQEQKVQAEGGVNVEDLPECPDHQPSSFLKGKPRSIISIQCFYKCHLRPLCLMHQVIRVDWNHLLQILSLSR